MTYQPEFLFDEAWEEGMKILCKAYVDAENFDRTLPHTKGNDGDARVFPEHRMDSIKYAREVFNEAEKELKGLGLDANDRAQLRHHVVSMTSKAQAEIAGVELRPLNGERHGP